jgi:aminobenzoyl-glutamate utilization protein B
MKRNLTVFVLCLIFLTNSVMADNQATIEKLKTASLEKIEKRKAMLIEVSDSLWDFSEIALLEYKSSKLLADIVEKEGFTVKRGVADLPTAFVATYGSGKPVIGILAEYDALPGLSQESCPYQKARETGEAGHGCGHNLFGAGSLGAALALKDLIEDKQLKGTIKLYGCPAEEDVGGKLYMARDGLFNDLDACLAWHPSYETKVDVRGNQAIDDLEIEFFGKASHAAFDPWQGRSALDALEMTTFGVNLLREHVKPTVRLHYVIVQGGKVPNVTPDYSKLWLWVRDSHRKGVKDVVNRIEKIVSGSAVATETDSKISNLGSYHEMLVNVTGSRIMQHNLECLGCPSYTEEELLFARRLQKETNVEEKGMFCEIAPLEDPTKEPEGGSSDVAEVSWITPTVHVSITCTPYGIPWHSWAVVASCKHSIGYKGMLLSSKVMALTAIDFICLPEVREEMKKEFNNKRGGYTYQSGIPSGKKPPKRIK